MFFHINTQISQKNDFLTLEMGTSEQHLNAAHVWSHLHLSEEDLRVCVEDKNKQVQRFFKHLVWFLTRRIVQRHLHVHKMSPDVFWLSHNPVYKQENVKLLIILMEVRFLVLRFVSSSLRQNGVWNKNDYNLMSGSL